VGGENGQNAQYIHSPSERAKVELRKDALFNAGAWLSRPGASLSLAFRQALQPFSAFG
jgi:hypothetical protein